MATVEALTLLISLLVLSKSSSVVVENAVKLSKFFRISNVAIGFLLLSVSTSLPELSVAVISSTMKEGALAVGNVFGSNIANILLILGIGASLYGLKIRASELKDIAIVLVLTTVLSAYIIFNNTIRVQAFGLVEGIVLLCVFGAYAIYIFAKKKIEMDGTNEITKKEALHAFLLFSGSLVVVLVSAGIVVESAVKIARMFNISESLIGATIIAIGTSLPELSIDVQAIKKKQYGLALGDAIGSNMVNMTLVLGTAAVMSPISLRLPVLIAALLFAMVANVLLFYAAAVNRGLRRLEGAVFLLVYLTFIITMLFLQVTKF